MRRRHHRANPTGAQWLLIAGAAGAVGVIGYLIYKANQPAQLTSTVAPVAVGTQSVTLAPGAMPAVTLSLSLRPTLSVLAPLQGTLGTGTLSPTGIVNDAGSFNYQAAAAGSTTLTMTWTDSTGTAQTSTIPITVTT